MYDNMYVDSFMFVDLFVYREGKVQIEQSNCKHFTMNPIVGLVANLKQLAYLWALLL
jgi:hypothetical protein